MSSTRRGFVRGSLAAAGLAALARSAAAGPGAPRAAGPTRGPTTRRPPRPYAGRPHYVVEIAVYGGFDAILSFDPKDQSAIGSGIDCGYRPDQRIKGAHRLFGPLIGGLARHDARMCLVHGVRVDTVAHPEGQRACETGKISPSGQPAASPILAARLPGGAPLGSLDVQCLPPRPPTIRDPADLERPLHRQLLGDFFDLGAPSEHAPTVLVVHDFLAQARAPDRAAIPWSAILAEDLIAAGPDPARQAEVRERSHPYLVMLDLMDRVTLPSSLGSSEIADGLGIAVDVLRDNVARHVRIQTRDAWVDSHTDNYRIQASRMMPILSDVARFLDLLGETRNPFGTLAEQTTVVLYSELGRFPKLNHALGKDHFPESSWMMWGRGVRPGATVGLTDGRYQAVPIDFRTGHPDRAGRPVPIDSMFATLYDICGVDLASHGYRADQVLGCVKT